MNNKNFHLGSTKILFTCSIVLIIFTFLPTKLLAIETVNKSNNSKLEYKIAKGYSNKFCNAIGIGVSVDGALTMAISENKEASFNPSLWLDLAFKGEEEINSIDKDKIKSIVSSEVVEKCGYPLGLAGEDGIKVFEDMFTTAVLSQNK